MGLPARVASGEVRVTEDSGGGEAEHLLAQICLGIGVVAATVKLALAEKARTAGDRERDDDAIPFLELAAIDARSHFLDDAHRFMPEDVARLHEWNEPVQKVEVGPADAGGGDSNTRLPVVADGRVGHVYN